MMRMKAALALTGISFALAGAQSKTVGWSTGYHTTWGGQAIGNAFFKAYTHVMYFSGSVNPPGASEGKSFSDAVHKGGSKAILCIGGWGAASSFENNSNSADKRAAFVKKIMDGAKNGGFDGVDIDWEEEGGGISNNYALLVNDLRVECDKTSPKMLLTIATADNQVASAASVKDKVDQMNAMSYWTLAGGMAGYLKKFTDKGIAKSVLGVGYGYDTDGELDVDNPTDIEAKINFAINNGYGGIMIWEIARACQQCNDVTAQYVDKTAKPTAVRPDQFARLEYYKARTLSVSLNPITGAREIRYAVAGNGGRAPLIDLGLYDMQGGLVKSLVKGPALPGEYALPLGGGQPARAPLVVKLATPEGIQAVPAGAGR